MAELGEINAEPQKRSLMMPIAWIVLSMLVGAAACAGIALGVNDSEESGILAATISAFPIGFVLTGALGGLVVHFGIRRATTLLRVVGPMGCGCTGGFTLLALAFLFFQYVFPSM